MTRRFKDEIGNQYGKLTVLRFDQTRNGQPFWICRCWCRREVSVRGANLRSGNTKSCGSCSRKKQRRGPMQLKVFGHVLVVGKADVLGDPKTDWVFLCKWCPKGGVASELKIRNAKAPLCDCLKLTYYSWKHMIERCTNKNHRQYKDYGGRGISVCQRWRDSFSDFVTDMGRKPEGTTLDRKNNDAGYYKGNCKWATGKEQAKNRRKRNLSSSAHGHKSNAAAY
jgi:hypothetical protein